MTRGAGSVGVARPENHRAGGGSSPTPALQDIVVRPVHHVVAKGVLGREHYLHSLPGGTKLAFGTFVGRRLLGVLTLGAGPKLGHRLVDDAAPHHCLTLTRLWLSDELPSNSENRVIGVVLRSLKRNTSVKFLLSYADPSMGHLGTVYQATGWLYTGTAESTPLYDLGDGVLRHSRSLGHAFGSRSVKYLTGQGLGVEVVPQGPKHRYVYFLDRAWHPRLRVAVHPYPKAEQTR